MALRRLARLLAVARALDDAGNRGATARWDNNRAGVHCHLRRGQPGPGNRGNNRVRGATAAVVHKMPKAGGASFVTSLVALNCDAPEPARIEWSEQWSCSAAPRFLLLREPTAHVISMYNHCQRGHGFVAHRYDRVSLAAWLRGWATADGDAVARWLVPDARRQCNFWPRNFQASAILRGATCGRRRLGTYKERPHAWGAGGRDLADWAARGGARVAASYGAAAIRRAASVGVTRYMDASVCVAFFALHGALPAGGACDFCATRARLPAQTHDVNHTEVDAERLDAATLALARDLTRVDELLFAEALSSFVARARRVENATGVALLCDLDVDDPPASGSSRMPAGYAS